MPPLLGITLQIRLYFDVLFLVVLLQTDADRRFLAAKGSVPIGIGKNSHIKRAIIDKNARIGDNVKVNSQSSNLMLSLLVLFSYFFIIWREFLNLVKHLHHHKEKKKGLPISNIPPRSSRWYAN